MGSGALSCDFCGEANDENDDPILKIFSNGKYGGKYICWCCLKEKIEAILITEGKVIQIRQYTKP